MNNNIKRATLIVLTAAFSLTTLPTFARPGRDYYGDRRRPIRHEHYHDHYHSGYYQKPYYRPPRRVRVDKHYHYHDHDHHDNAWALGAGLIGGAIIGGIIANASQPEPQVGVPATPVVPAVPVTPPPPSGYYQDQQRRVWVEGKWINSTDQFGNSYRSWQEGHWETRNERVWVPTN